MSVCALFVLGFVCFVCLRLVFCIHAVVSFSGLSICFALRYSLTFISNVLYRNIDVDLNKAKHKNTILLEHFQNLIEKP